MKKISPVAGHVLNVVTVQNAPIVLNAPDVNTVNLELALHQSPTKGNYFSLPTFAKRENGKR